MRRSIFRQVALERLSSPEQLDQLMYITTPRGWLALLALIGLIVTVVAWSFNDTIPTQVLGRGILIRGGQLARVVPVSSGQVGEVLAHVGDVVRQGQPLARIRPDASASHGSPEIASPVDGRVVDMSVASGS